MSFSSVYPYIPHLSVVYQTNVSTDNHVIIRDSKKRFGVDEMGHKGLKKDAGERERERENG
jgi:hypothetical protein